MVGSVRKRDGRIVPFDLERIATAIFKAAQAVGQKDRALAQQLAAEVARKLDEQFGPEGQPSVEEIQDIVERTLIEGGHYRIAKAYILYRERHAQLRGMKATFVEVQKTVDSYLEREDWRTRENANEDFSLSGLMLYTAGKIIATYVLDKIYTPAIAEAHRKGFFHIHDLSHGLVAYCAGWSLQNLILRGFGGVPNKASARPARHLDSLIHQMVNYIGCLQMEFAGAQSFAGVDTLLAPFVKNDRLSYREVKQAIQELIFSLNVPSRWGSQYPFSNLTFDFTIPKERADEPAVVGGEIQSFAYGDCSEEAAMINKAFLELMLAGDADGRVFTFPIPTYNLTSDFDFSLDSENTKLLFELTAKYGLPYFQNYIGSGLDPRSIHAMCCRLNINLKELTNRPGHIFAAGDNTGSIGVVTLNVNRFAYLARGDEGRFFETLEIYARLAKDSLEIKRRVITKNLQAGLMPYTRVYLRDFDHHFSTIGLVGMHEACLNLLGVPIYAPEGKRLAIETLSFLRELLREFQTDTGNLYNLEATPAEGASYRLAMLDKRYHKEIVTSGESVPYLTNSTQLPVDFTDDLATAIKHQQDLQPLYTGGTVFHTFLGQRITSEAAVAIVKKLAATRIPYFTITPTFSICKDHKYLTGAVPTCPHCGRETEVYSRIVGYFRPIKNWHDGKREEFRQRKVFNIYEAEKETVSVSLSS